MTLDQKRQRDIPFYHRISINISLKIYKTTYFSVLRDKGADILHKVTQNLYLHEITESS